MSTTFKLLPALLAVGGVGPAAAQILMVDAAGVRGLGSVFSGTAGIGAADYKFDLTKRNLNGTYIGVTSTDETYLFGAYVDATVPEGWSEIAHRAPDGKLALIGNRTWKEGRAVSFVTLTAGASGSSLKWRETATSPVQDDYRVSADLNLTWGQNMLPNDRPFAFAISAGVRRGHNLQALKEVEVDGRKVREGKLVETTDFPVTVRLNAFLKAEWITALATRFPGFASDDAPDAKSDEPAAAKARYAAAVGLYASALPKIGGRPEHSLGISISLQQKTFPTEIKKRGEFAPPLTKDQLKLLAYWKPTWTVYGEVTEPFARGPAKVKGGVATVFAWP